MSDSWAPNPGYCAEQLLWMHNVSIMHYVTIQNPLTLIMCCIDIGNTAEHRILMPQPLKLHSEDHLESSPSPKVSVFTQSLLWKCTQRIILCPVIVTFSPRTILQPKVPLESPPPQSVSIYLMLKPLQEGIWKEILHGEIFQLLRTRTMMKHGQDGGAVQCSHTEVSYL